jgi:peptidoglycan/xylan/chitin deacetylase (PgdA/CDA1 family)
MTQQSDRQLDGRARSPALSRREFIARSATALGVANGLAHGEPGGQPHAADERKALIAITLDLEMSRNFPSWDDTHWDYEKGNLDDATKRYAVEAARRVKAAGGVIHFFCVGRVLEQENVDWLKEIIDTGHPVGNHTYDHVNVLATRPEEIQFRFHRAPWLLRGRAPAEVITDNIRMCTEAMKSRLGIEPAGFRTPGGFANGLAPRPDIQRLLIDLGFKWISSRYPPHANAEPRQAPTADVYDSIVQAQFDAQPFIYTGGLVEVPMSPISDIGAFRAGRWQLDWFLSAIRRAVEWAIDRGAVFDFLAHPSCLGVVDPQFQAIDLITTLVRSAGDRAAIVGLGEIARRARRVTRIS